MMGTFEGHRLEEIDQGLYSCIMNSICVTGFDLNEDVLQASVFSPIMYDSLLIPKGSGKGHHHDAAGGGTIAEDFCHENQPSKLFAQKCQ